MHYPAPSDPYLHHLRAERLQGHPKLASEGRWARDTGGSKSAGKLFYEG
jgi:hypothetical protein